MIPKYCIVYLLNLTDLADLLIVKNRNKVYFFTCKTQRTDLLDWVELTKELNNQA